MIFSSLLKICAIQDPKLKERKKILKIYYIQLNKNLNNNYRSAQSINNLNKHEEDVNNDDDWFGVPYTQY